MKTTHLVRAALWLLAACSLRAVAPSTPSITTQPSSTVATSGSTASFTVVASAGNVNDMLTYQWQRNGVNLTGQTGTSLALNSVTRDQADTYDVVVTEGATSVTSASAALRVSPTAYPGLVAPDPTWNLQLEATVGTVYGIFPLADGSAYAVGNLTSVGGTHSPGIFHLTNTSTLDTSFTPAAIDGLVTSVAVQADGKILIGGQFLRVGGVYHPYLARLTTGGALDPTFTASVSGTVNAIVVQSDTNILVGGAFSTVNGVNHTNLIRLTATGATDSTFNVGTDVSLGSVSAIAVNGADGSVYIGGQLGSYNGVTTPKVAHLSSLGVLDTTFNTGLGTGPNGTVNALALDGNGGLLVGGSFSSVSGTNQGNFARLGATTGVLDTTYLPAGSGFGGFVQTIATQTVTVGGTPTTVVLVGGTFNSFNGASTGIGTNLMRLASNAGVAAIDPNFTAVNANGQVRAIAVQGTTGQILLGGTFNQINSTNRAGFARVSANGATLDSTVNFTNGNGFSSVDTLLALPGSTQVLIGGNFASEKGATIPFGLGRFDLTAGTLDTTFNAGNVGPNGTVFASALLPDGRIVIGGSFTKYNNMARAGVAVIASSGATPGALDTSFAPTGVTGGSSTVNAVAVLSGGRILVAGNFSAINGTTAGNVAVLNPNGTTGTFSSGSGTDGTINAVVVQTDGKIVLGGGFAHYNTTAVSNLVRLNSDGTVDTTFHPSGTGANGTIYAMGLTTGGQLVIAGNFGQYDGTTRNDVARLTTSGALDTGFVPVALNSGVYSLVVQEDGMVIVRGPTMSVNGQGGTYALARLTSAGLIDTTFGGDGIAPPTFSNTAPLILRGDGSLLMAGSDQSVISTVVGSAPAIASAGQPTNQTTTPGGTATFSVTATGSAPLSYQWSFNGSVIPGATASSYAVTNAGLANVGSYTVTVTDEYGSVTSNAATLSGSDAAPTVGTLATVTTTAGQQAKLTIAATANGSSPLSYQWQRNGVSLAGQNGSSYTVPVASRTDADYYDVIVYGGLTPVTSNTARIGVAPASYATQITFNPAFNTFEPEITGGTVNAMVSVGSSGYYLGGLFTNVTGGGVTARRQTGVIHITSNGTVDTAGNTADFDGAVLALAVQVDGKILVGGSFQRVNGVLHQNIARLNPDCSWDSTFNPTVNGTVSAVAVDAVTGKLYLGGSFNTVDSVSHSGIVRLNTDGTLDTSFAGSGGTSVNAIALQYTTVNSVTSVSGVVIGGTFTTFNGTANTNRIARLTPAGAIDPAFVIGSGTTAGADNTVSALAIDSLGNVLVGGALKNYNGASATNLVRLSSTGALDTAFNTGIGTGGFNGNVTSIALIGTGSSTEMLVGGAFTSVGGSTATANVVLLQNGGARDTGFAPTATPSSTGSVVNAVLVAPTDGDYCIGGTFSTVTGSIARTSFARYAAAAGNALDTANVYALRTSQGVVSSIVPQPQDAAAVIAGNIGFISNAAYTGEIGLGTNTATLGVFDTAGARANNTIFAAVPLPDGRYAIGGSFTSYDGVSRSHVAIISSTGVLDTTFNPPAISGTVDTLTVLPGGKLFVGGSFTTTGLAGVADVAVLRPDGSLDPAFNAAGTGANGTVWTSVLQPDGNIVLGGAFTAYNTSGNGSHTGLVRILPNGAPDTSFNSGKAGFVGTVFAVGLTWSATTPTSYQIFASGNLTSYNGTARTSIARINADGSLDTTFSAPSLNTIYGFAAQDDGNVIIHGNFVTTVNGSSTANLVRLSGLTGAIDPTFQAAGITPAAQNFAAVVLLDNGQLLLSENEYGLVATAGAGPTSILTQPAAATAAVGAPVSFTVAENGNAPVSYQWSFNGIAIPGATSATYSIPSASTANVGNYTVTLSGELGLATSSPAALTGTATAPTITTQPADTAAVAGTATSLSVVAQASPNTDTLTYQWYRNGYALPGQTSATLSIASPSRTDSDYYSVAVADGLTVVKSQTAALRVAPTAYPNLVTADPAWSALVEQTSASVGAIYPVNDGSFYAGGSFSSVNGTTAYSLVHVLSSNAVDPGFTAPIFDNTVTAVIPVTVNSVNYVLVAGNFYHVNGVYYRGLVRLTATGAVDTTFSPGFTGNVTAIAVQPSDNKIIAGGSFGSVGNAGRADFARLNWDGSVDSSFNAGSGFNGSVSVVAIAPGGQILVGGSFTSISGTPANFFAQVLASGPNAGAVDPAFNGIGNGPNNSVSAIAVDASGIYIGGSFTNYNGTTAGRIARLTLTGALDTASGFNTGAVTGFSGTVNSIVEQGTSGVLVGGAFGTFNSTGASFICRLTTAGVLDGTFTAGAPASTVSAIGLQTDSTGANVIGILVGGNFQTVNSVSHPGLARLTLGGAFDAGFTVALRTTANTVAAIVPVPGGQVLVSGNINFVGGNAVPGNIVRFNANGSLDTTFNQGGTGASNTVYAAARLPDGRIAIAGTFTSYNGVARNRIAILTASGALDPSFAPTTGLNGTGYTLTVLPGERLLVGGNFGTANGVTTPGVAVFNPDGTLYSGFSAGTAVQGGSAVVYASLLQEDGKIVLGGSFNTYNGSASPNLVRILPNGGIDGTFFTGTGPNNSVFALGLQANGSIVLGGSFSQISGTSAFDLARVTATGALDTSYAPTNTQGLTSTLNSSVFGLLTQENGSTVAGGRFNYFGGQNPLTFAGAIVNLYGTNDVQRELSTGSLDTGFAESGIGASNQNFGPIVMRDNGQLFLSTALGLVATKAGTAPALSAQPASATVASGAPATFTVGVTSSIPVTYQWFYTAPGTGQNAAIIPGAYGPTYTIPAASAANGGGYTAVVSSEFGGLISNVANLTITGSPVISTQPPAGGTLSVGQSAQLSVAVDQTAGATTYQWQIQAAGSSTWMNLTDGASYSGSQTATLTITSIAAASNGAKYQVVVTNPSGSVTSTSTLINTVTPPAWYFSTVGGQAFAGSTDGALSAAQFNQPETLAVDSAGTLYVSDTFNYTIRKITSAGVVSTLAGSPGVSGSADGTGSAARFNAVFGLVCDSAGNLYASDELNGTIRKITPAGVVTTIAGTAGVSGSADGTGSAAQFSNPAGLAFDPTGAFLYIADYGNSTVRKLTLATGAVTTIAGAAGNEGIVDGIGSNARFVTPTGLAVDGSGNLYVSDQTSSVIRMITPAGMVTTLAGKPSNKNETDGFAEAARFSVPTGLALDGNGNLLISDHSGYTIRSLNLATQVVTTIAGSAFNSGLLDGTGTSALFFNIGGIAIRNGTVYIADAGNDAVRQLVLSTGAVTTIAGAAREQNGIGSAGRIDGPRAMVLDGAGNAYIADEFGNTIRMLTPAGVLSTIAGSPGVSGSADGNGSAARFWNPSGIARDASGNLYVADSINHTIREIDPSGNVSTIAGVAGTAGSLDGTGTTALFRQPRGIVLDGTGANLYIADSGNGTIRQMAIATKIVTTIAGTASNFGYADGQGTAAQFESPQALALDTAGNLYVADANGPTVRMISTAGAVTTIAGTPNVNGYADGPALSAQFGSVTGIAVDGAGNVYISDAQNDMIRMLSGGVVSTLGGVASAFGSADGIGVNARFYGPYGLAWDGTSRLYICDINNGTIRVGTVAPALPTINSVTGTEAIPAGASATLTVNATGTGGFPLSYQWQFNGTNIATNATGASYTIPSPTAANSGSYTVVVSNVTGSVTSTASVVSVITRDLVNGSILGKVNGGSGDMFANFTVEGASAKQVLVRGSGPALTALGVSGAIADPSISVANSAGTIVATNSTWGGGATLSSAFSAVGAAPFSPSSKDAAVLVTLNPGTYSVHLSSVSNATGQALLEVYDADTTTLTPRIPYLSSRTQGTSATLGFVVGGSASHTFLVRAIGPSLGIPGAMATPSLSVANTSGVTLLSQNLGWGTAATNAAVVTAETSVGAQLLADNSKDEAAIVTLAPGNYTLQAASGTSGIVLLEVFEVDANRAATIAPAIVSAPAGSTGPAGLNTVVGAVFVAKPALTSVAWTRTTTSGGVPTTTPLADGGAISGSATPVVTITNGQPANSGSYAVTGTNAAGTVSSLGVSVAIGTAPSFTTQPTAQTLVNGSSLTLTAAATGSPTPTYQWFQGTTQLADGGSITGSATATLTISNVQAANSGNYSVVATNSAGSTASNTVSVTVNVTPTITTPPSALTVTAGQPATFTVVAAGTAPLTYQWFKGTATSSTAISGATGASYTINAVATTDQNTYFVKVTNVAGNQSSPPVALTVNTLPAITTQPTGVAVIAGATITLTTAASGTPAPTYQWFQGTTALVNGGTISGATSATLTITNATTTNAGQYTVVVTNTAAGATPVTSSPVTVAVNIPADVVTTLADIYTQTGATVTFTPVVIGTAPITYQWYKNSVSTPINGQTGPTLTLTNVNTSLDGSGYFVVVKNAFDPSTPAPAQTSNLAVLHVNPAVPNFTGSTSAVTGTQNRAFTYTPTVTGDKLTFGATGLPAGLAIDGSTGVISGTPTTATVTPANVTITASNTITVLTGGVPSTQTQSTSFSLAITIVSPPPVITSAAAANGTTGSGGFTYTTVASNSPTGYTATGLPTGLTINATTGVISGNVSAPGTYQVTITATNGTGSVSQTVTFTFAAPANAPAYGGATSLSGTGGTAFTTQSVAFTGTGPIAYALGNLQSGTLAVLPAGITLNASTGALTGTPTQSGTFPLAIVATNTAGSSTAYVTLTINPAATAPVIAANSSGFVSETVNTAFTFQVSGTNTPTSYAVTVQPPATNVTAPTLASLGMAFNTTTGVLSGTPVAPNTVTLTFTASNAVGTSQPATLVVQINPSSSAPAISSSPVIQGTVGTAFAGVQLAASNSPTSYVVTSGTAPAGLTINPDGTITGTPTAVGQTTVWVAASNSAGGQGLSLGILFSIAPAPTAPAITSVGSVNAQVGQPFTYQLTASNSPIGYLATGLPASGLSLSDAINGVISGTPTSAGTLTVSVAASSSSATGNAKTLTITIAPAPATPAITSASAVSGQAGTSFTFNVTASNTPTSFSALNLPNGLAINPATGVISGTPTVAGSFAVTLQAANTGGVGATSTMTIVLQPAASAPSITNVHTSATGTVGQTFSYTVTAGPGTITSFAVTGTLPSGLVFNTSTGLISGTPNEPGTTSFQVAATSSAGSSVPQTITVTVNAAALAPNITSSLAPAAGQVGVFYTTTVKASNMGNVTPFPSNETIDVVDLPPGLAVNPATGVVSGIPTQTGTFTAYAQALNAAGEGPLTAITFTVIAAPTAPAITNNNSSGSDLANPVAGTVFSYQLAASNSPTSYDGSGLPSWLQLNTTSGLLSGRPPGPGTATVSLTASNAAGSSQPFTLSLNISAAAGTPVVSSSRLPPTGTVNATFTYTVVASGSTSYLLAAAPLAAGSTAFSGLPSGLTFNTATGVISGTPAASGTYLVQVSGVNSNGQGQPVTVTLTFNPSLSFVSQ